MKKFSKEVDFNDRESMIFFLKSHFRYNTANGWNRSTSYAHNMKIYNLGFSREEEDKLWELLEADGVYDNINMILQSFEERHEGLWQAYFNGRSGGYLVLYAGGRKDSGYKSQCKKCGQLNFQSIEENGTKCGRCLSDARVNLIRPVMNTFTYPGRPIDMDADFEEWEDGEIQARAKLVCEFDKLADEIVEEVANMIESCEAVEEEYTIIKKRKVLQCNGEAV